MLNKLSEQTSWDIIIIGGGATGLGIAVDAASRGFSVLLLEQSDFAKGTSSRSTKLVHGGVRYLAQGNIPLVFSALRERGILLKNAPHLVKKGSFTIPCYSWGSKMWYLVGLKIYDWLSGFLSFGSSRSLNAQEVVKLLPSIKKEGLAGGVEYFDGQFDDARLALNLAQTAAENGAVLINYCPVNSLVKNAEGIVEGVKATDLEGGREFLLKAKVVINATGVFVNDILKMDAPQKGPLVRPSQGVHLVVNRSFMQGESALLIPKTSDGRVLYAIPWHHHLVIGTTDTPLVHSSLEPTAIEEEVDFILNNIKGYLYPAPEKKDILSVFAGLRPLAAGSADIQNTKELSRDHKVLVGTSGLITLTGGKWTTYRKMAEEAVNTAIKVGGLPPQQCRTKTLPIHGFTLHPRQGHLFLYGDDAEGIEALMAEQPEWSHLLVEGFPHTEAQVIWAVRQEMARTVEDVLARRLRLLFLDARKALDAAPKVAELMRLELKQTARWKEEQLTKFRELVFKYLWKESFMEKASFEQSIKTDV